nr:immunoglobulin light chain junction region [Macaca mulatta]MOV62016.1 immunoglobulin light chain junction region [Macaca mulatta]MOV64468.1 immunoglobulin light chain junction region [Macaca mulatta]MOV64669.1 immunoglobulin light chain junction region [Macaca mulatta]
CVQGIAFPFAF